MAACAQPGCTGKIVDGYCDVCGSPADAVPLVPAAALAPSATSAVAAGRSSVSGGSGVTASPSAGYPPTCAQPGCIGRIVDGYCDVCGSPADAVPFASAAASGAATPSPVEAGRSPVSGGSGVTANQSAGHLSTCTQPGCIGKIVDGYCDVCGSPADAVPFVLATASVASPVASRTGNVVGGHALADDVREAALSEVGKRELTSAEDPEFDDIGISPDPLHGLAWTSDITESIDLQGSREVEATLRRLIEPSGADVGMDDTVEIKPFVVDVQERNAAGAGPKAVDVEQVDGGEAEPGVVADVEEGDTAEIVRPVVDLKQGDATAVEPSAVDVEQVDGGEAEPGVVAEVEEGDTAEIVRPVVDLKQGDAAEVQQSAVDVVAADATAAEPQAVNVEQVDAGEPGPAVVAEVEEGDTAHFVRPVVDIDHGSAAEVEPSAVDIEQVDAGEAGPAVVADVEEGDTAHIVRPVVDLKQGDAAEVEPSVADVVAAGATADGPSAVDVKGDAARVEVPAVADVVQTDATKTEPPAGDLEKAGTAARSQKYDDPVKMAAPGAVLREDRDPQVSEQQVLEPEPVQTAPKRRGFAYVAVAATALAALLIGALLFAVSRDRDVTAQSIPSATATKPTNRPSNGSTVAAGKAPTIQLQDLPQTAKAFENVRIEGIYRNGPDSFLKAQRREGGQWLDFPQPAKTDKSGRFTTFIELDQPGRYRVRVVDPQSGVKSKTFVVVITI